MAEEGGPIAIARLSIGLKSKQLRQTCRRADVLRIVRFSFTGLTVPEALGIFLGAAEAVRLLALGVMAWAGTATSQPSGRRGPWGAVP